LFDLEKIQVIRVFKRKYKSVKYRHEKKAIEETRTGAFTLGWPVDHYNDVQKLFFHNDHLWVLSSTRDKEKGNLVDVFDMEGQYLNNFYLPLPEYIEIKDLSRHPITLSGDFLFLDERGDNDFPVIVKQRIIN